MFLKSRIQTAVKKQKKFSVKVVKEEDDTSFETPSCASEEGEEEWLPGANGIEPKPNRLTRLVSASIKDLGAAHSSMDVQCCLKTTCVNCRKNEILFLPRSNSNDFDTLKRTLWTICERERPSLDAVGKKQEKEGFQCTCGCKAHGRFYEI